MITSWLQWFSDVPSKFKPLQPRGWCGCWRSSPLAGGSTWQPHGHRALGKMSWLPPSVYELNFGNENSEVWTSLDPWVPILVIQRFAIENDRGHDTRGPYWYIYTYHPYRPWVSCDHNMLIVDSDPSQASMLNTLNVRWFGTWACLKIGYLQNLMMSHHVPSSSIIFPNKYYSMAISGT